MRGGVIVAEDLCEAISQYAQKSMGMSHKNSKELNIMSTF